MVIFTDSLENLNPLAYNPLDIAFLKYELLLLIHGPKKVQVS